MEQQRRLFWVAKELLIYYKCGERNSGFVVNGALIDFFRLGYIEHFTIASPPLRRKIRESIVLSSKSLYQFECGFDLAR
jgi:hypothetical protein